MSTPGFNADGYTDPCPVCGRRWTEYAIVARATKVPAHCGIHIYRKTGVAMDTAPLLDTATGELLAVNPVDGTVRPTGKKIPLTLIERKPQ